MTRPMVGKGIGYCFLPANVGLLICNLFLSVGYGRYATLMIVLRQVVLMVPLSWYLGTWGLEYVWYSFPLTEVTIVIVGSFLYKRKYKDIYK